MPSLIVPLIFLQSCWGSALPPLDRIDVYAIPEYGPSALRMADDQNRRSRAARWWEVNSND